MRHDADPVRFGAAVMVCEGFTPECSTQGRCTMEGRCFRSEPAIVAARMIEKLIPNGGHVTGMHFAYLRKCAEMLRGDAICL